jgi:hypothetical protein
MPLTQIGSPSRPWAGRLLSENGSSRAGGASPPRLILARNHCGPAGPSSPAPPATVIPAMSQSLPNQFVCCAVLLASLGAVLACGGGEREETRDSEVRVGADGTIGSTVAQDPTAPPGPVTATEFRLVRPDGSLGGVWAATEKGTHLSFFDAAGATRMRLFANPEGFVGAAFLDDHGKMQSSWSATPTGECGLVTYGADEAPRIELGSSAGDATSLVFRDSKGRRRSFTGILDTGCSAFTLFSPEDQVVATMGTPIDGEGSNSAVVLYDPRSGAMRAAMSINDQGAPMYSLHGENEKMRSSWSLAGQGGGLAWFDDSFGMQAVFGSNPAGSAGLMVFDSKGQVAYRAPASFDHEPGQGGGSPPPVENRERRRR